MNRRLVLLITLPVFLYAKLPRDQEPLTPHPFPKGKVPMQDILSGNQAPHREEPWDLNDEKERYGLEKLQRNELLDKLNEIRSDVKPPASSMKLLRWDDPLARVASQWAKNCQNTVNTTQDSHRGIIGQAVGTFKNNTALSVLKKWSNERENYDPIEGECLSKKPCEMYKSMMSDVSFAVGCAVNPCKTKMLLVCNFYPTNNIKGVPAYSVGPSCSSCDPTHGSLCNMNVCTSHTYCRENTLPCECNMLCLNCGQLDFDKCACKCKDGYDSPNCGVLCGNRSKKCGKNPGFPDGTKCGNDELVSNHLCREFCGRCRLLNKKIRPNDMCCSGKMCPKDQAYGDDSCSCEPMEAAVQKAQANANYKRQVIKKEEEQLKYFEVSTGACRTIKQNAGAMSLQESGGNVIIFVIIVLNL